MAEASSLSSLGGVTSAARELLVREKLYERSPTVGELFDLAISLRDAGRTDDGTMFAIAHSCREIWVALPSFYSVRVPRSEADPRDLSEQLATALPVGERERIRAASFDGKDVLLSAEVASVTIALAEASESVDQNIGDQFRQMCSAIAGTMGTDYVDPTLVRRWIDIRPSSRAHVRRYGRQQPALSSVLGMLDEIVAVLFELYKPSDIAYTEIDELLEGSS